MKPYSNLGPVSFDNSFGVFYGGREKTHKERDVLL